MAFEITISGKVFDYETFEQWAEVARRIAQFHGDAADVTRDFHDKAKYRALSQAYAAFAAQISSVRHVGDDTASALRAADEQRKKDAATIKSLHQYIRQLEGNVTRLEKTLIDVDRIGDAHVN